MSVGLPPVVFFSAPILAATAGRYLARWDAPLENDVVCLGNILPIDQSHEGPRAHHDWCHQSK